MPSEDLNESQPLLESQQQQQQPLSRRLTRFFSDSRPYSAPERAALQALFVVVVIITLVFGVLSLAFNSVKNPLPPSHAKDVCLTPDCVTYAAEVLAYLDPTVDPCDDFYQFTNGQWLKAHPVPSSEGFFGAAQDIKKRNARVLTDVLSGTVDTSLSPADQSILKNLIAFFDTCKDKKTIDIKGSKPLLDQVRIVVDHLTGNKHTRGPKLPATRSAWLTSALFYTHSIGVGVFFGFDVQGDTMEDPSALTLIATEGELGLPSQDYYFERPVLDKYETAIAKTFARLYEEMGPELPFSRSPEKLAADLVDLEVRLAKAQRTPEEQADPYLNYNKYDPVSFAGLLPFISTDDYFSGVSPRPAHPADPVIVQNPDYYKNLTYIQDTTDTPTLQAYFVLRTIQTLKPYISARAPLSLPLTRFENELDGISGEDAAVDIEMQCTEKVSELYGFALGRYFVEHLFAGDSKEYAENVINAIIQSFQDRLPELDWLDDTTRDRAKEKALAIRYKIGYPTTPNTTNADALLRYFVFSGDFPVNSTDYFSSAVKHLRAVEFLKWQHVHKQRDFGEWDMIPSEVNAYYNPEANEVAFPAGILQSPYFDARMPEYMAFGSFGGVSGHELTHAFDNTGSLYDKTGRLNKWMTDESLENFNNLTQCIMDQYAKYYVVDENGNKVYVRSKSTIGEDTADAGGISQAFRAWNTRRDSGQDTFGNYLLPGLNYTREQLFFIAYARGWWRNVRPAQAAKMIRTDVHAPTKYRVIGPLSNNRDFAAAFNCPLGSPMNPVDKCQVW